MKPRRETITMMTYDEIMTKILEIVLDSFVDSDHKNKVVMEVEDLKEIVEVMKDLRQQLSSVSAEYELHLRGVI